MKGALSERAASLVKSIYPETGLWDRLTLSFRREEIIEELASDIPVPDVSSAAISSWQARYTPFHPIHIFRLLRFASLAAVSGKLSLRRTARPAAIKEPLEPTWH